MTHVTSKLPNQGETAKLSRLIKAIYGSGDFGRASFNTLRQFFYAIFLTDVVGLDPRLASVAALVSIIWDAINDPLIGTLSDRVKTRWGRRRPFLLFFSVPFLLAFLVLWWAPPWESQALLALHVTLAFMVSDTLQTLVTVPYLALTPELATDYDERTSLTSWRMFFNLVASLATAVAAPAIIDSTIKAGFQIQQGYLVVAAIFGSLAVIPYLLVFFSVKEKPAPEAPPEEDLTIKKTLSFFWGNKPFRFASGIYVFNWISVDIVALMIPFFLLYWVAQGDLLATAAIFGEPISLESVTLGVLMLTATVFIPFWNWLARKFSKRTAYLGSLVFWIVVQSLIITIQPGQIPFIILLAFLAGIGISAAHIMPEAIFPDVIDWDELRTGTRREGAYYGAVFFLRKLSSAFAIFLTLQILGWVGYQTPTEGAVIFMQPPETLLAIRLLTGPLAVLLLAATVALTWFYPLTRERQGRIRRSLHHRQPTTKIKH